MKTKDDSTPFSPKSIIRTVKGAAEQMPKGAKGLLFLRLPTSWVSSALEDQYADVLAEGVRQTSRIAAIDKPSNVSGGVRYGRVNRHFHYFAAEGCPSEIWDFCMTFRAFWDGDFTGMAPKAPF